MAESEQASGWLVHRTLMNLQTPWLTLIGEELQAGDDQSLHYWRVEKADSVIILPLWQGQILLPPPSYRPGIGQVTLDLPGGRIDPTEGPAAAVPRILQRELGIEAPQISALTPLNSVGWPINSSFSNQRLFGFRAELQETLAPPPESQCFPPTASGVDQLLTNLLCLQCRAVVMEAWRHWTR